MLLVVWNPSEFTAKIASGVAATNADLSNTAISETDYRTGAGNLLVTYAVDSSNDGWITGKHATLNEAITSVIETKMYFMDGAADADAVITGPKTLNGNSLSITTNGNNISLDSIKYNLIFFVIFNNNIYIIFNICLY